MFKLCIGKPTGGPQRPILAFATKEAAAVVQGAIEAVWDSVADVQGLALSIVGHDLTPPAPKPAPPAKPKRSGNKKADTSPAPTKEPAGDEE